MEKIKIIKKSNFKNLKSLYLASCVVIGPTVPLEIVQKESKNTNSPIHIVPRDKPYSSYNLENIATVKECLRVLVENEKSNLITKEKLEKIGEYRLNELLDIRPMCRFEMHRYRHLK